MNQLLDWPAASDSCRVGWNSCSYSSRTLIPTRGSQPLTPCGLSSTLKFGMYGNKGRVRTLIELTFLDAGNGKKAIASLVTALRDEVAEVREAAARMLEIAK